MSTIPKLTARTTSVRRSVAREPDTAPASLWVGMLWGFIFSVVLFWAPLVLILLAIGGAA